MLITGTSYLHRRAGPSGCRWLGLDPAAESNGGGDPPGLLCGQNPAKCSAGVERRVFAQPSPGSDPELSWFLLSPDSCHPARLPDFHG